MEQHKAIGVPSVYSLGIHNISKTGNPEMGQSPRAKPPFHPMFTGLISFLDSVFQLLDMSTFQLLDTLTLIPLVSLGKTCVQKTRIL